MDTTLLDKSISTLRVFDGKWLGNHFYFDSTVICLRERVDSTSVKCPRNTLRCSEFFKLLLKLIQNERRHSQTYKSDLYLYFH